MSLIDEEDLTQINFVNKPFEKKYIICYVDVLGTKQIIDTKKTIDFFNTIYDAYSFAVEIETKLHIFGNLVFKVFSDNILIAHEITDTVEWHSAYRNVVAFLKPFLLQFLCKGILVRGGITIGELAINDVMVWGYGLVDAVNLEEKIAIYPRIVISKNLEKQMRNYPLSRVALFDEHFSCLQDNDGSLFVDYIDYREMSDAETSLKYSHEIMCEKEIAETDQSILQKIRWHLNYLEKAKDIFNEYYGDFNRLEWEDNAKNER